ncbi:hypothetical protein D3C81_2047420 [compost metagenome]
MPEIKAVMAPASWSVSNTGCSSRVTPTKLMAMAATSGHSTCFMPFQKPPASRITAIQMGAM